MTPLKIAVSLLLLVVVFAACGDDPSDEGSNTTSAVGVADALVEFSEAFVNNDSLVLSDYWSGRCGSLVVADLDTTSQALSNQFENYRLSVGEGLAVREIDDRLLVPLEQPDGALSATLEVNGQKTPLDEPLLFESDIEFVYEDGRLRVRNCDELFLADEAEEAEEPTRPR